MNEAQIDEMAAGLQTAAARLLRTLRRDERRSEISASRQSALAALAASGPMSLAALAGAQEVAAPTMSRIVEGLVREGLATREAEPANRRRVRIAATEEGLGALAQARTRRVRALAQRLARLAESEQRALQRGLEILERVTR